MLPETWLPTCTFPTGVNVPVAVTTCVIGPRVTVAVWNCEDVDLAQREKTNAITSRPTATVMMRLRRFMKLSPHNSGVPIVTTESRAALHRNLFHHAAQLAHPRDELQGELSFWEAGRPPPHAKWSSSSSSSPPLSIASPSGV